MGSSKYFTQEEAHETISKRPWNPDQPREQRPPYLLKQVPCILDNGKVDSVMDLASRHGLMVLNTSVNGVKIELMERVSLFM